MFTLYASTLSTTHHSDTVRNNVPANIAESLFLHKYNRQLWCLAVTPELIVSMDLSHWRLYKPMYPVKAKQGSCLLRQKM